MSQDKPRTREDILAENTRLAEKPFEAAPGLRRKSKAEIVASLMNRIQTFTPVNQAGEPVVVEPEEKLTCPKCDGRGWYTEPHPIGHPDFSKTKICSEPGCRAVKRNEEKRFISQQEQIRNQFGETIEWYEYASMSHYNDDDNRLAVQCARIYLRDGGIAGNDTVKHSMVFCGKVGTGKTYLMSAMRNELVRQGVFPIFLKVRTMVKGVQKGYSEEAELRDYQAENLLRVAPVLFIDELETGTRSGDRTDILESVIDYRCLHNLPTLISTNLEQDEVADAWNHRIQSRLVHMAWWVAMNGKTLRDTSPEMK